jgi:hypothetical protein
MTDTNDIANDIARAMPGVTVNTARLTGALTDYADLIAERVRLEQTEARVAVEASKSDGLIHGTIREVGGRSPMVPHAYHVTVEWDDNVSAGDVSAGPWLILGRIEPGARVHTNPDDQFVYATPTDIGLPQLTKVEIALVDRAHVPLDPDLPARAPLPERDSDTFKCDRCGGTFPSGQYGGVSSYSGEVCCESCLASSEDEDSDARYHVVDDTGRVRMRFHMQVVAEGFAEQNGLVVVDSFGEAVQPCDGCDEPTGDERHLLRDKWLCTKCWDHASEPKLVIENGSWNVPEDSYAYEQCAALEAAGFEPIGTGGGCVGYAKALVDNGDYRIDMFVTDGDNGFEFDKPGTDGAYQPFFALTSQSYRTGVVRQGVAIDHFFDSGQEVAVFDVFSVAEGLVLTEQLDERTCEILLAAYAIGCAGPDEAIDALGEYFETTWIEVLEAMNHPAVRHRAALAYNNPITQARHREAAKR